MTDLSFLNPVDTSDESVARHRDALSVNPDDPNAHAALAQIFEARHDLERAKAHAVEALGADAENVVAGVALARALLRERRFDEAETQALGVARSARAPLDARAMAWKLVGDARDRRGLASEAFDAFTRSNKLMAAKYGPLREMSHPAHPNAVRAMTRFAAGLDVSQWSGAAHETDAPVFLMSFPRSGTTLLDQVLSSHSRIVCMEETEYLWDALSSILRDGDTLEAIVRLSPRDVDTARRAYWRHLREAIPDAPADSVFIDRLPLHTVLAPVIKRIFPDCRIIFALRDPRDVVFSCYQQCFAPNVTTAQFWELDRAADYYDAVMRLFEICRERLALNIHEVRYCDVIADLEAQARKLADFLGVPFEESMLDYRNTALKRTINTASARQVIEPLYDRSIGRWRRYEREMAAVLPTLNLWAKRLGFDP